MLQETIDLRETRGKRPFQSRMPRQTHGTNALGGLEKETTQQKIDTYRRFGNGVEETARTIVFPGLEHDFRIPKPPKNARPDDPDSSQAVVPQHVTPIAKTAEFFPLNPGGGEQRNNCLAGPDGFATRSQPVLGNYAKGERMPCEIRFPQ